MSSVRRFQFDDSFDAESPFGTSASQRKREAAEAEAAARAKAAETPPPPPPPTFSEEELEAARKAAYAEGEKAGNGAGYGKGFTDGLGAGRKEGMESSRKEIQGTLEARSVGALEQLAGGVARLLQERNATNVARRDQPVHIAMAILRKVLPETARRGALNEIEGLMRQCLTDMIDEPRFIVRVSEGLAPEVRPRIEAMAEAAGFGARLIVVAEPGIGDGDCRIEWAEGGVERDSNQLLDDVAVAIEGLLEAPGG